MSPSSESPATPRGTPASGSRAPPRAGGSSAASTSRPAPSSPPSGPTIPQCATIGDLHHAIDSGLMRREDVRAELADVVSGRKPGRLAPDEIVVFDSTGTALEDVAAAALVYERALAGGAGLTVALGAA